MTEALVRLPSLSKYRLSVAKYQLWLLWQRLLRSVPVLGLLRGLAMRTERIQREKEDDAAYRRLIFTLGEGQPNLLHDGENMMVWRIAGEQIGHLAGLLFGAALLTSSRSLFEIYHVTWAVIFALDWVGTAIAVSMYKCRRDMKSGTS